MEIEDREITFKSWKKYAEALKAEVGCLQQFLKTDQVEAGYRIFVKEAQKGK